MTATKLLLLKDVEDLGRSGEIVSVKPGYARNKLLPSGAAIIADKRALRMQIKLQEERAKKAEADRAESEALKAKIESIDNLTTIVKVDHDGHMYGSVSVLDIVGLLETQASIHVEKRCVQLKHPIKAVGEFTVHLRLNEGVTADVKLVVEAESALGTTAVKS